MRITADAPDSLARSDAESVEEGHEVKAGLRFALLALCGVLALAGCSFLGSEGPPLTYWEPELSPDGTMLVYESNVDGTLELYTLELRTGIRTRLTENKVEDWSPTWSPEGDRIAFASSRDDNVDIYVLALDSREARRLTTDKADDINPHWGVDGRIYFNSNRTDSWEILVMDADGAELVQLTGSGMTE
jgi:Tol biopolymer transport system component